MKISDIYENYPFAYHMAQSGSWESIREHGLLSTSSLLDLYGYSGAARRTIEEHHRPNCIEIYCDQYGSAVVRDQKPMSENKLRNALKGGLSPKQWYKTLNSKTFFWVSKDRLLTMLNARAYREKPHDVIIVDTKSLVEANIENIVLCGMNSGNTSPYAHPRGKQTFRSISEYPFDERKRKNKNTALVELCVEGGVRDIEEHVTSVKRMRGPKVLRTIWSRKS